jgi:sulfite reductase alpha subunit-like flavoprotein
MGWTDNADNPIFLRPSLHEHIPRSIPPVTTLRLLFTHHLDFQSVPRRSFFELIRHFATDDMERDKLYDFCQEKGEGAVSQTSYLSGPRIKLRRAGRLIRVLHKDAAYNP